jgi:hypothetical protein
LNKIPIYSNDPPIFEALQRFRKDEIIRALFFLEADHPKLAAGFRLQNRHHAIVFNLGLQMSILGGLLPKRVGFWLSRCPNYIRKSLRFGFQ